jgi:hypothetical protein
VQLQLYASSLSYLRDTRITIKLQGPMAGFQYFRDLLNGKSACYRQTNLRGLSPIFERKHTKQGGYSRNLSDLYPKRGQFQSRPGTSVMPRFPRLN